MATFVKINEVTSGALTSAKLAPQAKILAEWLIENYSGETINQQDLLLELNTHQSDESIFKYVPKNPISGIYQFYRKPLVALGVIEVIKETKETGVSKRESAKDEMILKLMRIIEENGLKVE